MIVIGLLGGSTMLGTEPPLGGTVIPPSITYYRAGKLQTALSAFNSGPQSGLFACLNANGYTATVVERATSGINATNLQTTTTPQLLVDFGALGLVPNAIVLSHGGADAKNLQYATQYSARVFGPYWDQGPHSHDSSVVGRLREAFPALPLVVSTIPNHNGENLLEGLPASGTAYWHDQIRADQIYGCAHTRDCYTNIADPNVVTMAPDDHPDSNGYWAMGWMICEQIIINVGL